MIVIDGEVSTSSVPTDEDKFVFLKVAALSGDLGSTPAERVINKQESLSNNRSGIID
jgi:hypothetical protein